MTATPSDFLPRELGSSWRPLFEENVAEVRAVNLGVAKRAGLELSGLVVEGRRAGRSAEHGIRVAREAEEIHCAVAQQVLVGPAVGHVTGLAALGLHRVVLENKRTLFIRVAF